MSYRRLFFTERGTTAWRLLLGLMLVALLGRAILPAGYMPDVSAQGTLSLAVCTGDGMQTLLLELAGQPNNDDGGLDACPFGILAAQAMPASAAALARTASNAREILPRPVLRTLPPLSARGPPLGSRAPPHDLV